MTFDGNPKPVQFIEPNVLDGACLSVGKHDGFADQFGLHLCLPQIKPEHIGDVVHPGSGGTECIPLPRWHVISARPCSTISECAYHYNRPHSFSESGADVPRPRQRCGPNTRAGSIRSAVRQSHSAKVKPVR